MSIFKTRPTYIAQAVQNWNAGIIGVPQDFKKKKKRKEEKSVTKVSRKHLDTFEISIS